MTRKLATGILAAALVGAAGAWYAFSDSATASELTVLDSASFAQFKDDFNASAGNVRVIALLSPT
jgi:hypothetical protein